jgi:magnesium transporter
MDEQKEARRSGQAETGGAAARLGISSRKVGLAPGTVVYTGRRHVERPIVSTLTYDAEGFSETDNLSVDLLEPPQEANEGVQWVNVVGLHDTDLILAIGAKFGLHSLVLEDVAAVRSRPAFVDYQDHAFLSLKMLSWSATDHVDVEHVSLIVRDKSVLAFQERPGDVFDSVRDRLRSGVTRIRKRGADYLWYALIDAVVDHYLLLIEEVASRVDRLEENVWQGDSSSDVPAEVQTLRAETTVIRRALRPLRDEIDRLAKEPPEWMDEDVHPFLADLRAHTLQISDALESMRESLGAVMDAHLSVVSMRTNEVMKVLTIMASIFIPLTFVAGIYGMNFQHMPELEMRWAYPAIWAVMIFMGLGMVVYFRRRGWL